MGDLNVVFATFDEDTCSAVCEDNDKFQLLVNLYETFPNLKFYIKMTESRLYEDLSRICTSVNNGCVLIDRRNEFGLTTD